VIGVAQPTNLLHGWVLGNKARDLNSKSIIVVLIVENDCKSG